MKKIPKEGTLVMQDYRGSVWVNDYPTMWIPPIRGYWIKPGEVWLFLFLESINGEHLDNICILLHINSRRTYSLSLERFLNVFVPASEHE